MSHVIDVSDLPRKTVEEIEAFVAQLRQQLKQRQIAASQVSNEEWMRRFTTWTQSHRSTNPHFDDSREATYEGRGL